LEIPCRNYASPFSCSPSDAPDPQLLKLPTGAAPAKRTKYCAGTLPGGGRVVACLNKKQNQLSDACKKVLAGRKKQQG
jgi:hypothetical protein